ERSPANLRWTLKFFVSPFMGMADFFDTGNPAYLFEGFGDALGSMPIIENMLWQDAVDNATILLNKSVEASESSSPAVQAQGSTFLLNSILSLERVLF